MLPLRITEQHHQAAQAAFDGVAKVLSAFELGEPVEPGSFVACTVASITLQDRRRVLDCGAMVLLLAEGKGKDLADAVERGLFLGDPGQDPREPLGLLTRAVAGDWRDHPGDDLIRFVSPAGFQKLRKTAGPLEDDRVERRGATARRIDGLETWVIRHLPDDVVLTCQRPTLHASEVVVSSARSDGITTACPLLCVWWEGRLRVGGSVYRETI